MLVLRLGKMEKGGKGKNQFESCSWCYSNQHSFPVSPFPLFPNRCTAATFGPHITQQLFVSFVPFVVSLSESPASRVFDRLFAVFMPRDGRADEPRE